MRASEFFLSTLKEVPADAELISHQLMIRAGLIRRLGAGLYTWMPLGLKVLRRIETVIREEMNRADALELLMPAVQPAELWQESGRWEDFGPQMLRMKDRNDRDFCFGPTHEEVITHTVQREVKSYKQLPLNFYQIQTKFRDEIRPRFGVMRAREFIMKDAYSFHADLASLQETYLKMHEAYSRIFTRLGLAFRAVTADTGAIGGDGSHEFQVLADSGEDVLAFCSTSDYAANVELAEAVAPPRSDAIPVTLQKVHTPNVKTCVEIADYLKCALTDVLKTIAVVAEERFSLVLLRADHELNEFKLKKQAGFSDFRMATDKEIVEHLGCQPGSIGPVSVSEDIPVLADRAAAAMVNVTCGANEDDYHLTGVNVGRDFPEPVVADVRNVVEGDPSPDGKGVLSICRGIEVGHVFQLRTKYAKAMNATFLDETGQSQFFEMGCYGIGVTRIVAAAIEQSHDDRGIIFGDPIAPFAIAIAPINATKSEVVRKTSEVLYNQLTEAGIEALLDDRGARTGAMLADLELIGIPRRIVIGERALAEGQVEYQHRRDAEAQRVPMESLVDWLKEQISAGK